MPKDIRAQVASISDEAGDGQACGPWNTGRPGDTRLKSPVAAEDREALMRLVEAGKVVRRSDGRWGTSSRPLMTGAIAARLKERTLAVSGFEELTMVASDKGKRLYAEMKNAAD